MKKDELVAGGVAGAAFFASAAHIIEVVSETNHMAFALAYPFGIDGLIYIGIRAAQSGRKAAGFGAILIGAAYSLLFNAHAEGAIVMHPLLIAASMPVAMLVSFAIVHTGHGEPEATMPETIEKIVEVPVEKIVERIVTVAPALLPIVPAAPKVITKADAPKAKAPAAGRTSTGGRVATWDVEEAVRLHKDGRTDEDVLSAVDGLTAKPWQRTKRAVRLLADTPMTAEEIADVCGVSAGHVLRIRAAIVKVAA